MKKLEYEVKLDFPRDIVFRELFEPVIYEKWAQEFAPDVTIIGKIGLHEVVKLVDKDGNGAEVTITKYRENKLLELTLTNYLREDEVVPITEEDKSYDIYEFSGNTNLKITTFVEDIYTSEVDRGFQKAIIKIKSIFSKEQ